MRWQLSEEPLKYKQCKEFVPQLKDGDKVIFKASDSDVGTFTISDLPMNDAVLLLAITRHDTLSTAVAFESHVFASILSAQVAVIDAYKGSALSSPRIMDKSSKQRVEEL